jgi:hypothetical protein
MAPRLNHERITLERKPKLSVIDEAEFRKHDAAARWLERAEKQERHVAAKRKNRSKGHCNAQ